MNEQPPKIPEEKMMTNIKTFLDQNTGPISAPEQPEKKIEKKEIRIDVFRDIISLHMEDFIDYLKNGTISQQGIAKHMEKQYWDKIKDPKASGVTPGFFITALGTFKEKMEIPDLTKDKKKAQEYINKMMNNKKL